MPTTVEEMFGRVRGEDRAERSYLVRGTTDEAAARSATLAQAPAIVGGYRHREASARELENSVAGAFQVDVTWSTGETKAPPIEDGDREYSFSVQPAGYHVKQSRETIGVYPNTSATPRFGGAINVDSDLQVQGVDWPPPASNVFTVSAHVDAARVTQTYFRSLCALAGQMNSGTFEGFPAGELLFLGATGNRRGAGPWRLDFNLGFLRNETGLAVDKITIAEKLGWDVLWVHYKTRQQGGLNTPVVVRPVAAYVERICEQVDFGLLEPPPL